MSLDLHIPKELWSGHKVSYDRLRIFGCEAYAHIPKELRSKLEPKSRKCIFIGYGQEGEFGYRLMIHKVKLSFVAVMWYSMSRVCTNSQSKKLNIEKLLLVMWMEFHKVA